VLAEFESAFTAGEVSLVLGANVGIALHPEHASTADLLLQRADAATYRARHEAFGGRLRRRLLLVDAPADLFSRPVPATQLTAWLARQPVRRINRGNEVVPFNREQRRAVGGDVAAP